MGGCPGCGYCHRPHRISSRRTAAFSRQVQGYEAGRNHMTFPDRHTFTVMWLATIVACLHVAAGATTQAGTQLFSKALRAAAVDGNVAQTARSAVRARGWVEVPGGGTTSVADAAVVFQDRLYL